MQGKESEMLNLRYTRILFDDVTLKGNLGYLPNFFNVEIGLNFCLCKKVVKI